ncbi:hypothetical protein Patl1_22737 [Pistacia atlantica]|uniref:Uncharacterized protein n=1 Tax=Pistacia atlantica TaxID=434234 RepID=A0ACC0ZV03_9ROSI|nr:hypothetical protein Patl1_22737 [Pistacia atlantica]
MGRESMEEGLLPRSSVPETESTTNSIDDGDSTVTYVVVLSTLGGYTSPVESGIMKDLQSFCGSGTDQQANDLIKGFSRKPCDISSLALCFSFYLQFQFYDAMECSW